MIDFASASLDTLLSGAGHMCACGRVHQTGVRILKIGAGIIHSLPEVLAQMGKTMPFLVCDANTYQAAGQTAVDILKAHHMMYRLFVFPKTDGKIEPDEAAVGAITMALPSACDVIIAVGSGVINDCCKVVALAARLPGIVIATAPSMDGYASNSSSMIQNKIKVSLYNACPVAILCDTEILCKAPMEMLLAGLGDMLAKYISICEWRISHLITGEYYCENVASLVRSSVQKCIGSARGVIDHEAGAVAAIAEGLVLSGIAMSYAEISRPASGLEHYFSHIWEMLALQRGEASALHGTQVGVGTALTLMLYDHIRTLRPDMEKAQRQMAAWDALAWEAEMKEIFGAAAAPLIEAEHNIYHKNDSQGQLERIQKIIAHWEEILSIIEAELPQTQQLLSLMEELGMAIEPEDLSISAEDTRKAFIGSREIRDKYLTSSMLWDMGVLHAFADYLSAGS